MSRMGFSLLLCLTLCACIILQPTSQTAEPEIESLEDPTPFSPSPKATATYTPTPSVTPPASLADSGPWALVLNPDGIWAVNEDGSALTHLTQDVVLQRAISIGNRRVAYVTHGSAQGASADSLDLTLKVLSLPDGMAQTVTDLQIPNVSEDSPDDLQFAAEQVYRAVLFEGGEPSWAPDANKLAFVSGHGSTVADLYVYTPDTGTVTRLTDAPGHAYQLRWSPDSRHIFHTRASNFGSGAGYTMEGVWVAQADAAGTRLLYDPDPQSGAEVLVDWIAPDAVLVHSWRPDCGKVRLVRSDIIVSRTKVVWPDYLNRVIYNRDMGVILIDAQDIDCNPESLDGFYRIVTSDAEPQQISEGEFRSQIPEPLPDPLPAALKRYLETTLEVESVLWVEP